MIWLARKKVLDLYLWFYIALLLQFPPAETLLVQITILKDDENRALEPPYKV
jgi:hypothetical protein